MQTLSYGYKKPQDGDTGDDVFPALEEDIQQVNDHAHNGINSAPLASRTVSAPSGSWAAAPIAGGVYRQAVTLPSGLDYDICQIWFKTSTGDYVFPTVEKINSTSFYVYTNDNSLTYTCYFR